jgi:hypothetical protein
VAPFRTLPYVASTQAKTTPLTAPVHAISTGSTP